MTHYKIVTSLKSCSIKIQWDKKSNEGKRIKLFYSIENKCCPIKILLGKSIWIKFKQRKNNTATFPDVKSMYSNPINQFLEYRCRQYFFEYISHIVT